MLAKEVDDFLVPFFFRYPQWSYAALGRCVDKVALPMVGGGWHSQAQAR